MCARTIATARSGQSAPLRIAAAGLWPIPAPLAFEPMESLPAEAAAVVAKVATGKRRLRAGDFLYRTGTPFQSLFVVRAGHPLAQPGQDIFARLDEFPVLMPTRESVIRPFVDRLFITTSREGLAPGDEPAAGSLYAAQPGVRGRPAREFAG